MIAAKSFVAACGYMWCLFDGPYEIPPVKYDHATAEAPIILYQHSLAIDFACGHAKGKFVNGETRTQACAYVGDKNFGRCIIILPFESEVGPIVEKKLWRHERAHCNGWFHP